MTRALAKQTDDYDFVGLLDEEDQREEAQQRATAAAIAQREDFIWLLSDQRGRRKVREMLRTANLDVASDDVSTVLSTDPALMGFQEGLRIAGLRLAWRIARLAATGDLPFGSFQRLFMEVDE